MNINLSTKEHKILSDGSKSGYLMDFDKSDSLTQDFGAKSNERNRNGLFSGCCGRSPQPLGWSSTPRGRLRRK